MNEATGNVADPGSMTLMLNNGESSVQPGVVGRYSPKNPRSDLYGKIGRNTPIRVSAAVGDAPLSTRFVGEVVAWPPRWDVSEADRWVALEAAGILRRLGIPGRPLQSALVRWLRDNPPAAWWPLDDPKGSTTARSAVDGVPAMKPSGESRFTQPGSGVPIPAPGSPKFGEGDMGPLFDAPFVNFQAGGELFVQTDLASDTDTWRFEFTMMHTRGAQDAGSHEPIQ